MSLRTLVVSHALLAFGLGEAGIAAGTGKDVFDPPSYGPDRYEVIWKRSPFIVETKAVVDTTGLATKYSLVGLASLGGKPIAFLMEIGKDPIKGRVSITQGMPSADGVELIKVDMNADLKQTTVDIKQGSQTATLHFDPAVVPQSGPIGMTGGGAVPGAVPPPPAMPPPQIPNPRMPMINGQPVGSTVPPMGGLTPPTSPRRIIRPAPINTSNN